MSDYSQPEFYRYNSDSSALLKHVVRRVKKASHILELGAGAGILGIELANKLGPEELTLLELQEDFRSHLEQNLGRLRAGIRGRVIIESFGNWAAEPVHDLIVCNPPYFLPGHGEPSLDPRRQIARTFMFDGWRTLVETMLGALAPGGEAYFVVKNHPHLLRAIPMDSIRATESGNLVFLELSGLNKN